AVRALIGGEAAHDAARRSRMSWLSSLFIALLAGLVGLFAGGFAADLAVGWYRISSFEGGSGYFVVGMALVAGLVSSFTGLIGARVLARRPGATGARTAALVVGAVLATVGAVAGMARLLADVPPEIDGETLYLLVEVRFPAGLPVPAALTERPTIRLGAMSGGSVRREVEGPLWLDDARREGESWIVPGFVDIFTARGGRLLSVLVAPGRGVGTRLTLPSHPTQAHEQWSAWTSDFATVAPPGERVSFRYRVIRRSATARRQVAGRFTIDTHVRVLSWDGNGGEMGASSVFTVRHGSTPVTLPETTGIAVVRTSPVTLLVRHATGCVLLVDGASVSRMPVEPCGTAARIFPITSDPERFKAARDRPATPGWLDRRTFTGDGPFMLDGGLLRVAPLAFVPVRWPDEPQRLPGTPPLGLSHDGRALAWFSPDYAEGQHRIAVTDLERGVTTTVVVDRLRQRFRTPELDIDPDWFAYYYVWQPGTDGRYTLATRPDAVPRPFRGYVEPGPEGGYQAYTLEPAGRGLHAAIGSALLAGGGTPRPDLYGAPQVRFGGVDYTIQFVEGSTGRVSVVSFTGTRAGIMQVAELLDRTVATGRLDDLFAPEPPAAVAPAPTP
ncbi:MAG TPA: hypothetical protein VMF13_07000, partial [Luteitalea sp.]|nr:hypothetical protein [Luteitalea sp.]